MVAEEREPRYALERSLHFALLSGSAFALLLAIIALRWVVVRTLAPLQALGEAASAIEPDGKPETLDVSGLPSELVPMSSKFNMLLERLFATSSRVCRLHRAPSHALLSPMADTRRHSPV